MAVDREALKNHPGANPEYLQAWGRRARINKYVPHIGAKQRAKALKRSIDGAAK